MDDKTVANMGGTVLVEGVKDQSLIAEFYKDDVNKKQTAHPREERSNVGVRGSSGCY